MEQMNVEMPQRCGGTCVVWIIADCHGEYKNSQKFEGPRNEDEFVKHKFLMMRIGDLIVFSVIT